MARYNNAEDVAKDFGDKHPVTLFSHIMDTVGYLYGENERAYVRTIDGKEMSYEDLYNMWDSGDICVCVGNDLNG